MSAMTLRFLGVGGSSGAELGSAAAVVERDDEPLLLIDCGQDTPARFDRAYKAFPPAIFITHTHIDHMSGLEPLFAPLWFSETKERTKLFVPAPIVHLLHTRLCMTPSPLAEGGVNFWDAFQLIPVTDGFWLNGEWFDVFPVRHHAKDFAFGIRLAGRFVYTGDTRPIPETLETLSANGELIFHDCQPIGNPAHTGWDDLLREYSTELRNRSILYHFGSPANGDELRRQGGHVACIGKQYSLPKQRSTTSERTGMSHGLSLSINRAGL